MGMNLTPDMAVPGAKFTNGLYTFTITKVDGPNLWYKFDHWDMERPSPIPEEGFMWKKESFFDVVGIKGEGYAPCVVNEDDLWE